MLFLLKLVVTVVLAGWLTTQVHHWIARLHPPAAAIAAGLFCVLGYFGLRSAGAPAPVALAVSIACFIALVLGRGR